MSDKILVIGDGCIDEFVYGKCTRLCPDAPVPVFIPLKTTENGGMAKNVRANVEALGFECDLMCQDKLVRKTRYLDDHTNHVFIRVDSGENGIQRGNFTNVRKEFLEKYKVIIISDYNKGYLNEEDIQFICENHPFVYIDTKKHIGDYCKKAFIIKINEIEYENSKDILDTGRYDSNLIVTLGDNGCRYKGEMFSVKKVEVKDMSGAGDTFMASLVCKFLKTKDIYQSILFANQCASEVVQRKGVVTVEKSMD